MSLGERTLRPPPPPFHVHVYLKLVRRGKNAASLRGSSWRGEQLEMEEAGGGSSWRGRSCRGRSWREDIVYIIICSWLRKLKIFRRSVLDGYLAILCIIYMVHTVR